MKMEIQHNQIYNEDCLQFMKQLPDNYFDLIITDPPYGINIDEWDKEVPSKEYFDEMFRVSKNQIIFGGNYFELPKTNAWIVWYKRPFLKGQSEAELVWTSFDMNVKVFDYLYAGNCEGDPNNPKVNYKKKAVHKAEKPVAVGRWILEKFAKEGDLIFDPFAGSGSFLVACKQLNIEWVGCEIDKN